MDMDTYPTNMIKSNIVGSANDIATLGQTMLHIHEYKNTKHKHSRV